MRKSFFTVDFQNKETKTESSRPGLRSGVSVCQKGCEAPRTRTALKGLPQSEACDAKRGGPPKRVRSTEDEDGPERATAVRSPRRKAGRAAKKGAKHRGRARRAAAAQSEACDAKRGGPPKRVRSTEDEDSPERATAVRSPRRKAGRAAKKGAKPVTRRGTGCRRAFYIHFP